MSTENAQVAPLRLAKAHIDWSRRLGELSRSELERTVARVREEAGALGIWENGGFIPLQPFVVDRRAAAFLHRIGAELQELLISHALENAGHDLYRLADTAEWADEDRWFLSAKRPLPEALGCRRSDVFIENGRPRFLELNFGTCLNGCASVPMLSTALLGSEPGIEIRRRHGIAADPLFAARAEWTRSLRRDDTSAVALLGFARDGDEGSLKVYEAETEYFAAHGIPCDFVPMEEAEVVDGSLVWRGRPYGTAIRYFMAGDRVKRDHLDLVVALEHAERTVFLGSNVSQLFTSKALLADLYQDDRLTGAQRELLDYVPWTARLRKGAVRRGDTWVDPLEWAEENRENAVVKPNNLFGNRGVLVGRATDETEWRSVLKQASAEGGFVVQELVRPDSWSATYWDSAAGELADIDAPVLVGPYVVGGRSGGCFTKHPVTGSVDDLLSPRRGVSFGCVATAYQPER